jgi:hypothetical protein
VIEPHFPREREAMPDLPFQLDERIARHEKAGVAIGVDKGRNHQFADLICGLERSM